MKNDNVTPPDLKACKIKIIAYYRNKVLHYAWINIPSLKAVNCQEHFPYLMIQQLPRII